MNILFGDTETYSECDLKLHGTHRYAAHKSTEIIVWQWALNDGEPVVEDLSGRQSPSAESQRHLNDPNTVLVFHNSAFDRALIRECWGLELPIGRFRDTMVQALAHGLPGSLDKLSTILGLPADRAKDKRGRQLIQLVCKPQPRTGVRNDRHSHPEQWAEFLEYSYMDVISMREVHRKLPKWNTREGGAELALWHLDQRINDRGFAVDVDLAQAAVEAVAVETARLKAQTAELTDDEVSGPSKRDDLLAHILMSYGVSLPDMKADTLRRRVEDPELPEGVRLLLSIRLEATKTSTAKYKALINAVSHDGRLRNATQFCGAARTGRDAHRLFQPGNLLRSTMDQDDIDIGIEALKAGCATLIYSDVMKLSANAVRGAIIAPPGRKLVISDLANIEGRGLAYLAGEAWKVQAFRDFDAGTGPDLYKLAYARAFNIDPADVDKLMRQIGKVMELGLGYGGGVAAFLTFAAVYGLDLEELARAVLSTASADWVKQARDMLNWFRKKGRSTMGLRDDVWVACEVLVLMWRAAHPATTKLWEDVEDAVTRAILKPGQCFTVRQLKIQRDGAWLRIRLPSGRYLCYINPKVDEGQITYSGVSQYTKQWTRIKTYSGKLVENVTQAWARDVLFYNTPAVEAAGYGILFKVHDELPTEVPDSPEYSADDLSALMSVPPDWAADCPLAAAGFETYRYRKG